jgi:hypothetical protein
MQNKTQIANYQVFTRGGGKLNPSGFCIPINISLTRTTSHPLAASPTGSDVFFVSETKQTKVKQNKKSRQ